MKYTKPSFRSRRTFYRSREPKKTKMTRGRVLVILLASALLGILIGWGIGRMMNKALRIRKSHRESSATWGEITSSPESPAESSNG